MAYQRVNSHFFTGIGTEHTCAKTFVMSTGAIRSTSNIKTYKGYNFCGKTCDGTHGQNGGCLRLSAGRADVRESDCVKCGHGS